MLGGGREVRGVRELVMKYCKAGENCSRTILLAAAEKYGFDVSQEMRDCCNGISAGFSVGGICSSLVAAVMVLGILFDTDAAKQRTLMLFFMIEEKHGDIQCCKLAGSDCTELIASIGEELERVIAA